MRNVIFYFSGTGNSLALARELAGLLDHAEVHNIVTALNKGFDFDSVESLGIITPVYAYGAPRLVETFCKTIPSAIPYVYTMANFGTKPGIALTRLGRILKKNGIDMQGEFYVPMPENFIPIFPSPTEEEQEDRFTRATAHLPIIAQAISDKKELKEKNPSGFGAHSFVRVTGTWAFGFLDYGFKVTSRCTSCELCSKVCPVSNIVMVKGRPKWKHQCALCIACLQWCPVKAIEFGFSTQKKERYQHPKTKAADFIQER